MSVRRRRLKKGNKPATTPRVSVPKNARFPTRVTFEDFNFGRSNKEVKVLTDSGVKPPRSGRGYKPRKPGADFI